MSKFLQTNKQTCRQMDRPKTMSSDQSMRGHKKKADDHPLRLIIVFSMKLILKTDLDLADDLEHVTNRKVLSQDILM